MEIEITAKIDIYDVLDEINTYKANFREAYLVEALNRIEWYSERDEVTLSEAAKKQIYEWITRKSEWIETIYHPDSESMLKNRIPTNFYSNNDKDKPVYADTVAELITELKRLPHNLPVNIGGNGGVILAVYNVMDEDCHLGIETAI